MVATLMTRRRTVMLCCIIPMAIAAIATAITGSSVALFSGPMLLVSIASIAVSVGMMAYWGYRLFRWYAFGSPGPCCKNTCSSGRSCGSTSRMHRAMETRPAALRSVSQADDPVAAPTSSVRARAAANSMPIPMSGSGGCCHARKHTTPVNADESNERVVFGR